MIHKLCFNSNYCIGNKCISISVECIVLQTLYLLIGDIVSFKIIIICNFDNKIILVNSVFVSILI